MTDQQFQDLVFRLEGSLSNLGAKQEVASQQLSQQLADMADSIEDTGGTEASRRNAGIFVETLNRHFNFKAMRGQERPDQIARNQVYIAGITPAAASVLSGRGGSSRGAQDDAKIKNLISSIPLVGPFITTVFGTVRSIVGFLMHPANLITLAGMSTAFVALKKFFDRDETKAFFNIKDIYKFLTDGLGKLISFFGADMGADPGATVRARITEIKETIINSVRTFFTDEDGVWQKSIWKPLKADFKEAWNTTILPKLRKAFLGVFNFIDEQVEAVSDGFSMKDFLKNLKKFNDWISNLVAGQGVQGQGLAGLFGIKDPDFLNTFGNTLVDTEFSLNTLGEQLRTQGGLLEHLDPKKDGFVRSIKDWKEGLTKKFEEFDKIDFKKEFSAAGVLGDNFKTDVLNRLIGPADGKTVKDELMDNFKAQGGWKGMTNAYVDAGGKIDLHVGATINNRSPVLNPFTDAISEQTTQLIEAMEANRTVVGPTGPAAPRSKIRKRRGQGYGR
jgi:hypothetical protein